MLLFILYTIFIYMGFYLYTEIGFRIEVKKFFAKEKRIRARHKAIRALFEEVNQLYKESDEELDKIIACKSTWNMIPCVKLQLDAYHEKYDKVPELLHRVCKLVQVDILNKVEYET